MSSDDLSDTVRDSRWWYWIAAVPVLYVITFFVFFGVFFAFLIGLGLFGLFFVLIIVFALPSFILTLMLPYALYRDLSLLSEHNVVESWDPDTDLYVIVGAAGIFVTGLGFVVSIYYLYQRHLHVGVP